ncbi:MAG: efflux RND transporter periplasmic adaptor subunit [Gammaproteobacteria bacterium]|nr:efflux RND transporter periplasmic adaptor subunit [Gammaproteobacteria bacterium]
MKMIPRLLPFLLLTTLVDAYASGIAAELPVDQASAARLGIATARSEPVSELVLTNAPGRIVIPPSQLVAVTVPVSGILAAANVATGDNVSAGDVLGTLHSPDFIALQRDFAEASAARQLARAQLERDRGLFDQGIISRRRLDETTADGASADMRFQQARQMLTLSGMDDAALAKLAASQRLEPTLTLRAPIAGAIVSQLAEVGAEVPAMAAVYRIADLSTLWVEVNVSPMDAGNIKPGMEVRIGGDDTLRGRVLQVGSVVDQQAQTVMVRAQIMPAPQTLRAGQFVSAEIVAKAARPAMSVPVQSVVRNGGKTYVFTAGGGGFQVLPVNVLANDGGRVYIEAGFSPGANVVVDGVAALKAIWLADEDGAE